MCGGIGRWVGNMRGSSMLHHAGQLVGATIASCGECCIGGGFAISKLSGGVCGGIGRWVGNACRPAVLHCAGHLVGANIASRGEHCLLWDVSASIVEAPMRRIGRSAIATIATTTIVTTSMPHDH